MCRSGSVQEREVCRSGSVQEREVCRRERCVGGERGVQEGEVWKGKLILTSLILTLDLHTN